MTLRRIHSASAASGRSSKQSRPARPGVARRRWRSAVRAAVYREVKLIKEIAAAANQEPDDAVAIISYDEKPGIQAIATTAPDQFKKLDTFTPSVVTQAELAADFPFNLIDGAIP